MVTVLFADLKGSKELLADRGPGEVRRLLDPVLDRMMEAVHRYEGTVNQVWATGSWHSSARLSPTRSRRRRLLCRPAEAEGRREQLGLLWKGDWFLPLIALGSAR